MRKSAILPKALKVAAIAMAVSLAGHVTTGCQNCSVSCGGCGPAFGISCESGAATTSASCDRTYDAAGGTETCSGTRTYETSGKTYTFHSHTGGGSCSVTVDGLGDATCATGGGAMPSGGAPCATPKVSCFGQCIDTLGDNRNCGACGAACPAGQTCRQGACACSAPTVSCAGKCVDTSSDSNNCGVCEAACPAGMACAHGTCNCPTTVCEGTCVQTDTDAKNCGRCGHDCRGGKCIAGKCDSVAVVIGVGNSPGRPSSLAVDATNIYWTIGDGSPNGAVMKAPLSKGPSTLLATGQDYPFDVVVDATSVYWANHFAVMKCSIAGGDVTTLASGRDSIAGIAVDAAAVYFGTVGSSTGGGAVMRVPIEGGTPTVLASRAAPFDLATDGVNVYWTSFGGTVTSIPSAGGAATTLVSGQKMCGAIALDATNVYWSAGTNGAIMKVPLAGGVPVTLAMGGDPTNLIVSGSNIYWTMPAANELKTVSVEGGTADLLGSAPVENLAVDAQSVYWSNFLGNILKIAK